MLVSCNSDKILDIAEGNGLLIRASGAEALASVSML